MTVWEEIIEKREMHKIGGYFPHNFVELYGGHMVEALSYEPDPTTYRFEFYYNSELNILYRKIVRIHEPADGIILAYWRPISQK